MAVLLDTDHFSNLQGADRPERARLQARLNQLPMAEVKTSIISFQEQAQGWLLWIHRARKEEAILRGFHNLRELLTHYAALEVLPFDQIALVEFNSLKKQRIRISTNDLRITSIAKANGAKLLSRNLGGYRRVPGLDVEDWTT